MAYFLQEEPQDGTTIMNNAVRNGAIQEQQNLIDRARQAAIEQDPTLNFVERRLKSGLLDAKMGWQDAYNKGDAQGMVNAQKAADNIRQQAAAIGFQDRDFGADATLEQVAQNLANNDTRAINDLFYGMKRPGNYYQTSYDQYRDNGMSMNDAARNAQRDADNYQNDNIDRLVDAFHMYGTDPRGAINQNGLRLLGMMAQQGGVSPSELVNFYAKMQASPKDNWNFENSLLTAQNAQNFALDRMDRSQQYTRENQERSQNFQKEMAQLNNSLGLSREITLMQARIEAGLIQKDAAHNWLKSKYMAAGMDEQTAEVAALTSLVGGKGGKGSAGGFNKDLAKELRETANSLYEQAEAAELAGDKNRAAQLRQQADQYMAQHTAMLGGGKSDSGDNMFGVDVNNYNSLQDAFQKLINLNAKRPWNEQKTKAELVEIFLNKVGANNPMAQDIVAKAEWGDSSETPTEKPAEQPRQEPATPRDDEPSTSSENIGYKDNRSAAGRIWDAVTGALAPGWVKVRRNGQDMTISRAALKPDDEIIE